MERNKLTFGEEKGKPTITMFSPSEIKCPRCNSTQISANKKGFNATNAVAGAVLTGGIGVVAGAVGSNKVIITCLSCGKQFSPGEDMESTKIKKQQQAQAMKSPSFWIFFLCFFSLIIGFIYWLLT